MSEMVSETYRICALSFIENNENAKTTRVVLASDYGASRTWEIPSEKARHYILGDRVTLLLDHNKSQ